MSKFEALNILFKSLFEKIAAVVTIYNTLSLPAWCVSTKIQRCILGHKIGGFRASEGLPNKHESAEEDYANYGN